MKTMKTKLLAMLMAVTMVFAMAPLTAGSAFADDEGADPAGTEVTQDVTETDVTEPSKIEEDSVEPEVTEEPTVTKAALPETSIFAINGKEYKTTTAKGKGWTFKYKNGTGYLTLNKANITKNIAPNPYFKCGIHAGGMDLKITLKGKNKISSKDLDFDYCAVACEQKLTITGKGSLTINTPCDGLYGDGDINISKTRVYVNSTGGNYDSMGIWACNAALNIKSSTVQVKGESFHGLLSESLSISGSTVNANAVSTYGILVDKTTSIVNSKVTATGTYGYGIYGGKYQNNAYDMTVKDSKVTAKGKYNGIINNGTLSLIKTSKGKYATRVDATSIDTSKPAISARGLGIGKFRVTTPTDALFFYNDDWVSVANNDGSYATHVVLVPKKANTLKIKGKTATVKYSALQTADQTLTVGKVIKFVKKGNGDKTYSKTSGNANILVDETTGEVTVKTGLKKNKKGYKVKIKVTAEGNGTYLPKSKTVTVKIKVK